MIRIRRCAECSNLRLGRCLVFRDPTGKHLVVTDDDAMPCLRFVEKPKPRREDRQT